MSCRFYLACSPNPSSSSSTAASTTTSKITTTSPAVVTTTTAKTTTTTVTTTSTTSSGGQGRTTPVPAGPPRIYSVSINGSVPAGTLTPLTCLVEANPEPVISQVGWICNGNSVDSSLVTLTGSDAGWKYLTYTPIVPWDADNAGTCSCYASNQYSTTPTSGLVVVDVQHSSVTSAPAESIAVNPQVPVFILFQASTCVDMAVILQDTSDCFDCISIAYSAQPPGFTLSSADGQSQSNSLPNDCSASTSSMTWFWFVYDVNNIVYFGTGPTFFANVVAQITLSTPQDVNYIYAYSLGATYITYNIYT